MVSPAFRKRRLRRIRGRLAVVLMFLVPFCIGLYLVRLDNSDDLASPSPAGPGVQSVAALRGGETLVAPEGTVGRDIVDWLASPEPGRHYFELGGNQFEGDTSEPTTESEARLDRLAMMLKANRDVSVLIIGRPAPAVPPAQGRALAGQRTQRVRNELIARGIAPRRLVAEDQDASDPAASGTTPPSPAHDGRVAILLARGVPPDPRPAD